MNTQLNMLPLRNHAQEFSCKILKDVDAKFKIHRFHYVKFSALPGDGKFTKANFLTHVVHVPGNVLPLIMLIPTVHR